MREQEHENISVWEKRWKTALVSNAAKEECFKDLEARKHQSVSRSCLNNGLLHAWRATSIERDTTTDQWVVMSEKERVTSGERLPTVDEWLASKSKKVIKWECWELAYLQKFPNITWQVGFRFEFLPDINHHTCFMQDDGKRVWGNRGASYLNMNIWRDFEA